MSQAPVVVIKKVKKARHGGGHGSSSWKVAYADFVTAMMAFFLLLWLISMVAPEKRAQVSQYFKEYQLFDRSGSSIMDYHTPALPGMGATAPAGQPTVAQTLGIHGEDQSAEFIETLRREIEERLAEVQDQILIETFDQGVRIEVMDKESRPMFPLGSAALTPAGHRVLEVIARILSEGDRPVALEGHTDSRIYTSGPYSNWELSTERVSAARLVLENNGLRPERLVRVSGFAATAPLIPQDPADPRNRRISILIYNPRTAAPS